ncbi:MAG: hypothetical protein KIH69_019980 [Anaerolineae bacterium]|nr:hypothetical protein [Anaerolineae bacterium]
MPTTGVLVAVGVAVGQGVAVTVGRRVAVLTEVAVGFGFGALVAGGLGLLYKISDTNTRCSSF